MATFNQDEWQSDIERYLQDPAYRGSDFYLEIRALVLWLKSIRQLRKVVNI